MGRIGFNTVAPRDKFYAGGVKPSQPDVGLGPGKYEIQPKRSTRPAYAPFNTTQGREHVDRDPTVPGPGAYLTEGLKGHLDSSAVRTAFKSASDRFKGAPTTETPGPGAYCGVTRDRLGRETMKTHSQSSKAAAHVEHHPKVQWVRVPSAPSIPGHKHAHGYEEGEHGELIAQVPAHKGYTGLGGDTVGPLDYKPRIDYTRPTVGKPVNFAKYSGREDMNLLRQLKEYGLSALMGETGAAGLGMDESEAREATIKNLHNQPKESAVFSSKTKRIITQPDAEAGPGPGAYKLPGAISVVQKEDVSQQYFGSTVDRFSSGPRGQAQAYTGPGPGSYRLQPSDFDIDRRRGKQRKVARNLTNASIAFDSRASRFHEKQAQEDSAAPGAYEMPTLVRELERKKRMSSKVAVFGSTTNRFASGKPRPGTADALGSGGGDNGSENPVVTIRSASADDATLTKGALGNMGRCAGSGWNMGGVKGRDVPRQSAVFVSETLRGKPAGLAIEGPAPGQYDVATRLGKASAVNLGKGGLRFSKDPDEHERTRGPGAYDVTKAGLPRKPSNRRNVMLSSQNRFGPDMAKYADKAPGPGTYDLEYACGGMIKPTFNVAIAQQCGALC